MTDLIPYIIPYIIGAVVALIGAGGLRWLLGRLFRAGTLKDETQAPLPPAPPKHTAEEHENAQDDETADAVDGAAADHGVDPDVVNDLVDAADRVR